MFIAAASGSVHAQRAMSQACATSGRAIAASRRARACRHADNGRLSLDRRREGSRPLRRPDVPAARTEGTPNTAPAVLGVVAAPDGSVWARLRGMALLRSSTRPSRTFCRRSETGIGRDRDGARARHSILAATLGRGATISRNGRVDAIVDTKRCRDRRSSFRLLQRRTATSGSGREAPARCVQGTHVTRFTDGFPDLKVNCLLAMDDHNVWIGTDKGVVRWTGTEISRSGIPDVLTNLQALAMIRDRRATSGSRPDRTDSCAWTIGDGEPLGVEERARPNVSSVFEDRDGNIWSGPIAVSNVGAILRSRRSRRLKASRRRPSDPCTSTIEDARGLRRRAAACSGSRTAWLAESPKGGSIAKRNACRAPWTNTLDFRTAADVPIGRFRPELTAMRLTEAEGLPQNSSTRCARARRRALGRHAERGREPDRERGRDDLHHRERPGLQYHHVDR